MGRGEWEWDGEVRGGWLPEGVHETGLLMGLQEIAAPVVLVFGLLQG